MSLKFTFSSGGEGQHDHSSTDEQRPGAISLTPTTTTGLPHATPSQSSVLELRVTSIDGNVRCEGVSGDGVTYSSASVTPGSKPLAEVVRSAIARAGAALPEPLLGAVTAVVFDLSDRSAEVARDLGLTVSETGDQLATVSEALQMRTGVSAGTPILRAESE